MDLQRSKAAPERHVLCACRCLVAQEHHLAPQQRLMDQREFLIRDIGTLDRHSRKLLDRFL